MARHFRDDSAQRAYASQSRRSADASRQGYARQQGYQQQSYQQQGAYQQQGYTAAPYDMGDGRASTPRRRKKKKSPLPLILAAIVLAAAGVGIYLFLNPPFYGVTVNGTEQTVNYGTTVAQCIEKGYAAPTAGNLIAVDGSIAQQGGGEAFSATVNGNAVDGSYSLKKGDDVQISDGADKDEEYTETTETVSPGVSGTNYSTLSSYYLGSIHVYSSGEDGEKTVKTGTVSGKTVEEITKQPIDAGYNTYNANVGDEKVIALTFDDGPWATTTTEILDILKENGAKATFFQIGNQIADMPSIEKRIVEEGHQVGTHTYDHASGTGQGVNLTFMSAEEQRIEISKGFAAIEETLGTTVTHIMRAPGGNYYGSLIDNLKDLVVAEIGWNVDTEDWSRPGADAIAQAILSVKPGQVILMHDGGGDRSQTVEALRTALPQLIAQGYKCVTIDELMAYGK
ncbi:polysaccharide deacetylase family protein [Paratractidigestivibacter sp.]|uniref:polysaccharide deacetylase family protein n=1 Tax=Paratractidigestivibacter sp. TaxID=2847316 RepID=UPI002ACB0812|nr:polysaccharide deacetylase family protein [Paratractidigestivibacter sp.]